MARPPQYERPGDPTRDATAVKAAVKHLTSNDRAALIAWILLYYQDDGTLFSQQIRQRRRRIVLDGVEYWLVKLPKRSDNSH